LHIGFPISFFPTDLQERLENVSKATSTGTNKSTVATSGDHPVSTPVATATEPVDREKSTGTATHQTATKSDFWDILIKLDASFGTHHQAGFGVQHGSTPRKTSGGTVASKNHVRNVVLHNIFLDSRRFL